MGQYLAPDLSQITEPNPPEGVGEVLIKRNVTITTDAGGGNPVACDATSAVTFITGIAPLATDECGNPFPPFTVTPELHVRSCGDYRVVLIPTALDAASDIVDPSTSGHKFKLYIGTVGTPPSDGIYKAHFAWLRCA